MKSVCFLAPAMTSLQVLAAYIKPDGTPNDDVAFKSDLYDDLVIGACRMYSLGAAMSSPAVANIHALN